MSNSTDTQFNSIIVALCDINGTFRGKRLPVEQVGKVLDGALRMPISASTVDIWGRDIEGSSLVFESGDADGVCRPLTEKILPSPWLGEGVGFLPMSMHYETGEPHPTDPRAALSQVVSRYADHGLTPVVATELEFYLTDLKSENDASGDVSPSARFGSGNVLSVQEVEDMAPFLDDVYAASKAHGIPADAAISETGVGQFEINILHSNDPLKAADDALLFKRLVKGCARQHGFAATFMAKPFGQDSGSGLHVHFSLLDSDGNNVFDDGTEEGSDVLRAAIGGLTAAMQESTLIFAPHLNSYRRIRPHSHAPTTVGWGYENRTAAIRIPGGNHKARRIEHRVAGADANPYLVLAVVLGAALEGIEAKMTAPAPISGNVYEAGLEQLPMDWASAIAAFDQGNIVGKILDPMFKQLIIQAKQQELATFLEAVTPFEYKTYLEVV